MTILAQFEAAVGTIPPFEIDQAYYAPEEPQVYEPEVPNYEAEGETSETFASYSIDDFNDGFDFDSSISDFESSASEGLEIVDYQPEENEITQQETTTEQESTTTPTIDESTTVTMRNAWSKSL